MKNLFNLDTPFMQMLTRVGDMIIVNFLCMVCCIPIITAGASISATHRLMQDIVMDNEGAVFKTFFRVFKENFKQATIAWLVLLVVIVSLVCDFILITFFVEGTLATVLYILLAVLAFLVLGVASFLYPLLTRYQNTLREHLTNSLILTITRPHIALAMVALLLSPVIIFCLSTSVFFQTLVFWIFIGFAFIIYLDNVLLKKVYTELEKLNN